MEMLILRKLDPTNAILLRAYRLQVCSSPLAFSSLPLLLFKLLALPVSDREGGS